VVRSGELALSEEQVQRLLENVTRPRDYHLLKLEVLTGMRRSDIVRVKWDNFTHSDQPVSNYARKKDGVWKPPRGTSMTRSTPSSITI